MLQHHKIKTGNLIYVSKFLSLQLLCKKHIYVSIRVYLYPSMDIWTPPCAWGGQRTLFESVLPSTIWVPDSKLRFQPSLLWLAGLITKHHYLNSNLTGPCSSFFGSSLLVNSQWVCMNSTPCSHIQVFLVPRSNQSPGTGVFSHLYFLIPFHSMCPFLLRRFSIFHQLPAVPPPHSLRNYLNDACKALIWSNHTVGNKLFSLLVYYEASLPLPHSVSWNSYLSKLHCFKLRGTV